MSGADTIARLAVEQYHADQRPEELEAFALLLGSGCRRGTAVELGTFRGGMAWFLSQLFYSVVTVDRTHALADAPRNGIRYVLSDSAEAATQYAADLVFIDADHSYDGVRRDWEAWRTKVAHGGLVAFHDIVEHAPATGCEVARLWREVRADYTTVEIVGPESSVAWAGIGVVFL